MCVHVHEGLVSPLPTGPPVLLPSAGSPPEWGPHSQFWQWYYKCVCGGWGVCVCVCTHAQTSVCALCVSDTLTLCLCGTLTGVGGTDHVTRPSHDCQRTGNLRRTGRERWQRTIPS